jgi:hypothetical protein
LRSLDCVELRVFGGLERVVFFLVQAHSGLSFSRCRLSFLVCFFSGCLVLGGRAAEAQQEPPYFVTYSSVLEEPGNLEIENQNIAAAPKNANAFFAPTVEFEYGVTAWWMAEAYLQGQTTKNDSTVFTGFRFENRFRPLPRQYWINPVTTVARYVNPIIWEMAWVYGTKIGYASKHRVLKSDTESWVKGR